MTYEKISNISLLFRKRQERNKDVLCVSTGEKGDGKSTYVMQQARDYLHKFGLKCKDCQKEFVFAGVAIEPSRSGRTLVKKKMIEPCPKCKSMNVEKITRFNYFNWLAYDASEVEDMIFNAPECAPIISDELARFALAENWNTSESKNMKKLLIQCRTKRLIILGNIPDFITLDSKYRNMSNYWVRILQRDNSSSCAVFVAKSKGEYADKYHIKELQEMLGDYFEDTPMDDVQLIAQKLVQRHPCVYDWFMIPPLPKDMYDDYEVYRDAKVFEKKEEEIMMDERQIAKVILYSLKKNWKLLEEAVKKGRYDSPSLKMMEDLLVRNPKTGNALMRYTTIRNHIRDVEAAIRATSSVIEPDELSSAIVEEVK